MQRFMHVRSSARLVSWDVCPIASHWCAVTAYISFCSLFRRDFDVRQLKNHRTSSGEDDSWDYFLFVQTSPSGDCYFEVSSQCARVVLFVYFTSSLTEVRELCLPVQFNAVDRAWNMASHQCVCSTPQSYGYFVPAPSGQPRMEHLVQTTATKSHSLLTK